MFCACIILIIKFVHAATLKLQTVYFTRSLYEITKASQERERSGDTQGLPEFQRLPQDRVESAVPTMEATWHLRVTVWSTFICGAQSAKATSACCNCIPCRLRCTVQTHQLGLLYDTTAPVVCVCGWYIGRITSRYSAKRFQQTNEADPCTEQSGSGTESYSGTKAACR